ncbi:hypothetical protein IQ277_01845 [Nostocales cyanobacterium LEGE 12452]|nr:hypothetical protein [Nostocales cyanobacterium LEGE 12452]
MSEVETRQLGYILCEKSPKRFDDEAQRFDDEAQRFDDEAQRFKVKP